MSDLYFCAICSRYCTHACLLSFQSAQTLISALSNSHARKEKSDEKAACVKLKDEEISVTVIWVRLDMKVMQTREGAEESCELSLTSLCPRRQDGLQRTGDRAELQSDDGWNRSSFDGCRCDLSGCVVWMESIMWSDSACLTHRGWWREEEDDEWGVKSTCKQSETRVYRVIRVISKQGNNLFIFLQLSCFRQITGEFLFFCFSKSGWWMHAGHSVKEKSPSCCDASLASSLGR